MCWNFSLTDRNVECQDFQASSTSFAECMPDQLGSRSVLLIAGKSALSKLHTLLPGTSRRPDGEPCSLQKTGRWSERPKGAWVEMSATKVESDTKTKSNKEPKLPSWEIWVWVRTHLVNPR